MQYPGGVTNPTRIEGHLDDLLFYCRRLPWVTLLQQERVPRTVFFSALVPLLALAGLAMANDGGPVTVRTVPDLENHDATLSRWGESVAEILMESSTSTPVRHLRLVLLYTSQVVCKGRLTMDELIFSLKHNWCFVDSEPLERKTLSQGMAEKAT